MRDPATRTHLTGEFGGVRSGGDQLTAWAAGSAVMPSGRTASSFGAARETMYCSAVWEGTSSGSTSRPLTCGIEVSYMISEFLLGH